MGNVPVFQNPIIRGFNPDPTVCVVRADPTTNTPTRYFLSTSTFEYFPGCPIYMSEDVVNWKLIGHALTRPSQLSMRTVEPGAGCWASTLRYREKEKRWYLTSGVFQRYRPKNDERIFPRGFYVWTDNIYDDAAWSDPIYFDNPGFDQDLFWDDADGKVYLSTTTRIANRDPQSKLKDFAIHVSEIDLPTGRTLSAPVCVRQSPYGVAEGSHIVKKGGFYYLFVAEGGTEAGHQEWVFRSKTGVFGPWESQGKPLWYNGPDEEVQRTGHADVFEDNEERWWGVFLGVRPIESDQRWLEPQLGRETFLVKVDWVNGWPIFNEGNNITLATKGRSGLIQGLSQKSHKGIRWRANLGCEELELGWYQKNTPLKHCCSLTAKPGFLRLWGSCYDLSSPEAPSMLLRKQESYFDLFHAKLSFTPNKAGYEAGILVWWNMFSYATIGITRHESRSGEYGLAIVMRQPTGEADKINTVQCPIDGNEEAGSDLELTSEVELWAEASPTSYELTLKQGQVQESFAFGAKALTVMPPVGAAFTGAMFGIYSFGKGEPVLDPADFHDIYIKEGV